MRKIRKLVLSLVMLSFTIATFISTTFAFLYLREYVSVEKFDMKIESEKGLLISIDGVNYSQNIGSEKVIAIIEEKVNDSYTSLFFNGVTPKHDANGNAVFNSGELQFERDAISRDQNGKYSHYMADASIKEYISFDLWFKVIDTEAINDGVNITEYKLSFNDDTSIEGTSYSVNLENQLTAMDGVHNSSESITVNPKDAMRIAFVNEDNDKPMMTYEPSIGLASAALTSEMGNGNKYDPYVNAMYTYYNNINPLYPFIDAQGNYYASEGGEGVSDTINSFSGDLGTFTYNNGEFNTIKLKVYIWLEGWDADYFMGIPFNTVSIKLGFKI